MTDAKNQTHEIAEVLILAAAEYEHDEPPTHLYLNRKDGEWEIVFVRDLHTDPLDMIMTRWGDKADVSKYFDSVKSGRANEVAAGISAEWDAQWDS